MKPNIRILKKSRKYTEAFKRDIVKDYEKGQYSVRQISKLNTIHPSTIYRWIHKYSNFNDKDVRIVEKKKSSSERIKQLEEKVKELERTVGRKQIEIDYFKKMVEIASEDLEYDIKKNTDTPHSGGSEKTKRK